MKTYFIPWRKVMRIKDFIKIGFGLGLGYIFAQATVGAVAFSIIKPKLKKEEDTVEEENAED